jgi:hypothetical protein
MQSVKISGSTEWEVYTSYKEATLFLPQRRLFFYLEDLKCGQEFSCFPASIFVSGKRMTVEFAIDKQFIRQHGNMLYWPKNVHPIVEKYLLLVQDDSMGPQARVPLGQGII